jgi:hypothetical protein
VPCRQSGNNLNLPRFGSGKGDARGGQQLTPFCWLPIEDFALAALAFDVSRRQPPLNKALRHVTALSLDM